MKKTHLHWNDGRRSISAFYLTNEFFAGRISLEWMFSSTCLDFILSLFFPHQNELYLCVHTFFVFCSFFLFFFSCSLLFYFASASDTPVRLRPYQLSNSFIEFRFCLMSFYRFLVACERWTLSILHPLLPIYQN